MPSNPWNGLSGSIETRRTWGPVSRRYRPTPTKVPLVPRHSFSLWNRYDFTSRIGVIAGARWFAAGRNTSATITPVVAVNMVY